MRIGLIVFMGVILSAFPTLSAPIRNNNVGRHVEHLHPDKNPCRGSLTRRQIGPLLSFPMVETKHKHTHLPVLCAGTPNSTSAA
ncbi:hypothetical protein BD410DRAFT_50111 [Rickenella mellea]|uniref:Secreted protein n=1 Tax=Rickenella mellea TaxID=50990 RepID=A0A4R5XFT2_9AGAM|nr:hypothetical protein BD410DRAFT_50111 [Rickenella mellea]